jgi:small subunit ribosomal protein S1
MSWTKKVVNPNKVLNVGDEVEAIVSELDVTNRRISLSLRQTEANPWDDLANDFPVGTIVEGNVRNLTEFGAFVEITDEIDGLIHVSDMSWTKRIRHPGEVLEKGDPVKARITSIDVDNQRVSLSIKEFLPNEWQEFIDDHLVGDTVEGRVVNITEFGLFIDIYDGLEGLAHVSEIDIPGTRLEDHYAVGRWVRTRILRVNEDEHKIGLTMRGVNPLTKEEAAELEAEYQAKQPVKVVDEEETAAAETVEASAADDEDAAAPQEAAAEDAPEPEPEVVAESAAPEESAEEEAPAVEAAAEEAQAEEEAAPAEETSDNEPEAVSEDSSEEEKTE